MNKVNISNVFLKLLIGYAWSFSRVMKARQQAWVNTFSNKYKIFIQITYYYWYFTKRISYFDAVRGEAQMSEKKNRKLFFLQ